MKNKETVKEEETVFIDGAEFKESELSKEQVYMVSQIQETTNIKVQQQRELDRTLACLTAFKNQLIFVTKQQTEKVLQEENKSQED